MNALSISAEQFQQIVSVCKRVIINTSTPTQELRSYLVLRLYYHHPAIARALMELDDDQFGSLCHEILQALHTDRN